VWPLLSAMPGLIISERAWRTKPKSRPFKPQPPKDKSI